MKVQLGNYNIFTGLWFEVGLVKYRNALKHIIDWQLNLGWLHINKFKAKNQRGER